MRILSRTTYRLAGVLFLASVLLGSARTAGQAQSRDSLINVRFAGGTASQYISTVRKAAGGDINVIVASDAAKVSMPPVTLKNISVEVALQLLDGKTDESPEHVIRLRMQSLPTRAENEQPTYEVKAEVRRIRQRAPGASVWTISDLLDNDIPSTAVLSAVEMALEVVGSETTLDVRFHEDTGLLIAMGDLGQMETIEGVLDRLKEAVHQRREKLQRSKALARVTELEVVLTEMNLENNGLRAEYTRLEILNAELSRMLERREGELTEARRRLRSAVNRLAEREPRRRDDLPDDHRQ